MRKKSGLAGIITGLVAAASLAVCAPLTGCMPRDGKDGADGKDLNIYDVYEAAKTETGNPSLTFDEFLKEYFSYTSDELEDAASLQSAINRSLMSSVTVGANFRHNNLETVRVSGSGTIIDIDKVNGNMTVITNCHVVYSPSAAANSGYSTDIKLWLYGYESAYTNVLDKNAIDAQLVAASKTYDIAVLRVSGSDIVKRSKAIAVGWSAGEENYLGERVYAIGDANGEKLSANVGYISKDLEEIIVNLGTTSAPQSFTYNVMRFSAPINSGNSGGGLFNSAGELVGVVNAKGKADVNGVGYALTAAATKRVVGRMLNEYAQSGVCTAVPFAESGLRLTVSDSYSTGLNDKGYAEICETVMVTGVEFVCPAAGKFERDDVLKHIRITRPSDYDRIVEDMDIKREHNFRDAMLAVEVGDEVALTVRRGASDVTMTMRFGISDFKPVV